MSRPYFLRVQINETTFRDEMAGGGVPLVNLHGDVTNFTVLQRWIGRRAAIPLRETSGAESSIIYSLGDKDGLLAPADTRVEPLSVADVTGRCKKQLDELEADLTKAKTYGQGEERLKERFLVTFRAARERPSQAGYYFFKNRSGEVIWCWGYRRASTGPETPVICRECRTLAMNGRECPNQAKHEHRTPDKPDVRRRRWPLIAAVAVVLLALTGGAVPFLLPLLDSDTPPGPVSPGDGTVTVANEPKLVVTPSDAVILPRGARQAFRVLRVTGATEEDVTSSARLRVDDFRVVRPLADGVAVQAVGAGKAEVRVEHGNLKSQVTVTVNVERPRKLRIEPDVVELGVGTTNTLKLIGEFPDGREVDLSSAASWSAEDSGRLYVYHGVLQGKTPGETKVTASYDEGGVLADSDTASQASARAIVLDERYVSLTVALDRSDVPVGEVAALSAKVTTATGVERFITGSSELRLTATPAGCVEIADGRIKGSSEGLVTLRARFRDLESSASLSVKSSGSPTPFEVTPNPLRLAVGEEVDLSISGASPGLAVTSSQPDVLEVAENGRVVGLRAGEAVLRVSDGNATQEVSASVVDEAYESLRISPSPLVVPLLDVVPVVVLARTAGPESREVRLSNDGLEWTQLPSLEDAEFDVATRILRGRRVTDAPQVLAVRRGNLEASAVVTVVAPPLVIELAPRGSVELPVEQTLPLRVTAVFGDGRRVEVPADQVAWDISGGEKFVKWTPGVVGATAAGGEVTVRAKYEGQASEPLTIRTVAPAADVQLSLLAVDSPLFVGSKGQFRVGATGPQGTLALDESRAQFSSSNAEVLVVDATTGAFEAKAPGVVTINVAHPAAGQPASRELAVIDQRLAKLVLRPQSVRVAVDTQTDLTLILIDDQGRESDCTSRTDVAWRIGDQAAVEWAAPTVTGLRPSPPFALTATLAGLEAVAMIEVVEAPPPADLAAAGGDGPRNADSSGSPAASDSPGSNPTDNNLLRVTPAVARLAPLDSLAPQVERLLADGTWVRVRPDHVRWEVPAGLEWSEARESVPARLTVPADARGEFAVAANWEGRVATLNLTVDASQPPVDPNDAEAELVIERDPPNAILPVLAQQRFRVVARKGNRASEVPGDQLTWQAPFENEYLRWQPPLVTALAGGRRQVLNVEVAGRNLAFEVETAAVSPTAEPPPAESGLPTPEAIRFEPDAPGAITLGVGMTFDRFRVVATSAGGGPARDVTSAATIQLESADSAVSFEGGRFVALRSGRATAKALIGGLVTENSLTFQVERQVQLTRIEVRPKSIQLGLGDAGRLFADGYAGEDGSRYVGSLNQHPGLAWRALQPEGASQVVRVDGSLVTALNEGRAGVTAQLEGLISEAAEVVVSSRTPPRDELLQVEPARLSLRPGETRILGADVRVSQHGLDVVDGLDVASSDSAVVRYDVASRTLYAERTGRATLSLVQGRARGRLDVIVSGDGLPIGGAGASVVLEPSQAALVIGQTLSFRVIVVDPSGRRVDRTATAAFESSDESILSMRGGTARADGAGEARVRVTVAGIAEPAQATVRVSNDPLSDFQLEPSRLDLAIGQTAVIRVSAVGQGVRRVLNGHARLRFASADAATFLELDSSGQVHALGAGTGWVDVTWNDQPIGRVPVDVRAQGLDRLEIVPRQVDLNVAGVQPFQVFAWRGNVRLPVTIDDGATLVVANPSCAETLDGFSVRALAPGASEVVAQWGIQRATAIVRVRQGSARSSPIVDELRPSSNPPAQDMLSFEPAVIRLNRDGLPFGVRVIHQTPTGRRQDVGLTAQLTFAPAANPDVVSLAKNGATVIPQTPGVTFAHASWEGLTTSEPLRIEVRAASGPLRLRLSPNPLVIRAGETGWFHRAEVLSDEGMAARAVPVALSTDSPEIVEISGLNLLARRAGTARVTARVVLADHPYDGLTTSATVEVPYGGGGGVAIQPGGNGGGTSANSTGTPPGVAANPDVRRAARRQLWLSGPDRTWVGASVGFAVNVVEGSQGWPVTEEAELIVHPAFEATPGRDLPAVSSGAGSVAARRPGLVRVQARWRDLVSNTILLRIDEVAARFQEIRLDMDQTPMRIGESRAYRVLGVPADGGPVQDLTGLVGLDRASSRVFVAVRPGETVHAPPRVTAQVAGNIELAAVAGEARSGVLRVPVRDGGETAETRPLSLRIEPQRRVLRRGETCPPWTVWAQFPGEAVARPVAAVLTSQDTSVLRPVADRPGSFVADATGDARIVATWNGRTAEAVVSVVGGAFESVDIVQQQDSPNYEFTVTLRVRGAAQSGITQYRLLKDNQGADRGWTNVVASGNPGQIEATMVSPSFPSRLDQIFRLTIEGRDDKTDRRERYPYLFRFQPKAAVDATSPPRP